MYLRGLLISGPFYSFAIFETISVSATEADHVDIFQAQVAEHADRTVRRNFPPQNIKTNLFGNHLDISDVEAAF